MLNMQRNDLNESRTGPRCICILQLVEHFGVSAAEALALDCIATTHDAGDRKEFARAGNRRAKPDRINNGTNKGAHEWCLKWSR